MVIHAAESLRLGHCGLASTSPLHGLSRASPRLVPRRGRFADGFRLPLSTGSNQSGADIHGAGVSGRYLSVASFSNVASAHHQF